VRRPLRAALVVAPLAALATCVLAPRAPLLERVRPAEMRLHARPLVLAPGVRATPAEVADHLKRVGYREAAGREVGEGEFRVAAGRIEVGRRPFRWPDGEEPGGLVRVAFGRAGEVREVTDADGAPRPAVWLEPERLGARTHAERPVPLGRIPQEVIDAVLVQEDRRFFSHPGLDPVRIAGAALANLREGRVAEGASTITQQLARSLYLTQERSLRRKVREAALAVWLECRHTKREILEAYLNRVYLGHGHGAPIHGVARAARFYLGKDVARLGASEAALLAGMIRAPNHFSPFRHPERARAQRDRVLDLLLAEGRLDPATHARARAAPLALRREPAPSASAHHFAALVRGRVAERLGAEAHGRRGGLDVWTTLDAGLQRAAEDAVRGELARLEARAPRLRRRGAPLQAALVALDPRTGDVLAHVGGRGPDDGSSFDRAVAARRQAGSLFKPIVALAALTSDAEPPFTLATLLEDGPFALEVEGETWRPTNYDGRYRGAVTLRTALEQSLNVPFARLGLETGLVRVAETARRLGVESPLRPVPSLALGAFEMTPFEATALYAALAAGGVRAAPRTTLAVTRGDGRALGGERVTRERVFPEREVYLVTSALEGAALRGTGRALAALGVRGVAGKTGTSSDARDAWFVGYTPELAVGVWVGFDSHGLVGATGAEAALPIFARFVRSALGPEGSAGFEPPAGLERADVHAASGLRAGPGCDGAPELFARGTAPARRCRSDVWARGWRSLEALFGR